MKATTNNIEYIKKSLFPESGDKLDLLNAYNLYSQSKFNAFIKNKGLEEDGSLNQYEEDAINKIKDEINQLKIKYKGTEKERLEFDLAKIFHSNFKTINIGRWQLDNLGLWRWISLNYFLEEVRWRWAEDKFKKEYYLESARLTYDHLVGVRTRDIFPRRYFLLGERLFDSQFGYELIDDLASISRASKSGGFGNLINNINETKLISPNEHIAKTLSRILFCAGKPADDKEVRRAFVRYNGFKRRLLNSASEEILKKEICQLSE